MGTCVGRDFFFWGCFRLARLDMIIMPAPIIRMPTTAEIMIFLGFIFAQRRIDRGTKLENSAGKKE